VSAPSGGIEKARALMAWLWDELAEIARLARVQWPGRNSPGHIAAAQFELEVKRVRRASGEKDGRRIGAVRLGRAVRVPLSEIEQLMEDGTTPAIK
jgi:hypothetical protein